MEIIKANQLITSDLRKSILEKEIVYQNLSDRYLKIARSSARRLIKEIPDRQEIDGKERGLVHLAGIIAKGICKDYSIREVDQAQVFRFYSTIRDYYNQFSLDEIRLAFELALVGDLDDYLPKDSRGQADKNAYQNFSLEFICKILNAYKAHRQKVWNKIYKLAQDEPIEISEEQKKEHHDKFLEVIDDQYQSWKSGAALNLMFAGYIVKQLIKEGWIVDRQISEQERVKAFHIIMSQPLEENQKRRLKIAFSAIEDNTQLDGMAERLKNESLIIEAFKNKRKNESA